MAKAMWSNSTLFTCSFWLVQWQKAYKIVIKQLWTNSFRMLYTICHSKTPTNKNISMHTSYDTYAMKGYLLNIFCSEWIMSSYRVYVYWSAKYFKQLSCSITSSLFVIIWDLHYHKQKTIRSEYLVKRLLVQIKKNFITTWKYHLISMAQEKYWTDSKDAQNYTKEDLFIFTSLLF